MAAIYAIKDNELRVYRYRTAKKNGAEPMLLWLFLVVPLALLRLGALALVLISVVFVDGVWDLLVLQFHDNPPRFVNDLLFTGFLVCAVCSQFAYIVFSPAKKEIYWKFLFIRRHLAWFDEIEEVREGSKKFLWFTFHFFSAVPRKGAKKKPFRISTQERKISRFALYYHYIAPIANDMLRRSRAGEENEDADAAETVFGEAVEVPVDEAEKYLREGVVGGSL